MTIRQIGIDIGKSTFHVIGLGAESGIELRKLFSRSQLLRFMEWPAPPATDRVASPEHA